MTGNALKRNQLNKILLSPERRLAVALVAQGFAIPYVAKRVNLTRGAVYYWSRAAGVKTTDHRNGRTKFSRDIVDKTENISVNYLQAHLKLMMPIKQIKK